MGQLKRLILLFLLLAYTFSVEAQKGYFNLKEITKDSSFLSFPVFSRARDSLTAQKINTLLQLSELELIIGQQKNNIFENIIADTEKSGKWMICYQIYSNSPKVLSIQFSEAFCGAGCNTGISCYNFSSVNGYLIHLKDIFTDDGYTIIKNKISEKRIAKFKKDLIKIDSIQRNDLLTVLDCYKDDALRDYYIQSSSIIINSENCLDKNAKNFDINTLTQLTLPEFKEYLTEYRQKVFGIKIKHTPKKR